MSKSETLSPDSFAPAVRSTIGLGFRALSDSLRLRILELLRDREFCVCELCDRLDTPQSKLSFHLKVLRDAQLVHHRQEGRWVYYSLDLEQVRALERYLSQLHRSSALTPAPPCS
ncbi:MAG: helix-turn-helix transcriptional regulator [Cyanobacteria bacterium SID2]|nr:helix-turn-helix transcriptional regulator [Cyanobacteria bacterium SID2]MBP0006652.1 helix-turn-helix transcriptional regulator [Cyanobacteria bacterium SBC]